MHKYIKYCWLLLCLTVACNSSNNNKINTKIEGTNIKNQVTSNSITITEKIKYGETLSSIFKKHRIEPELVFRIVAGFKQIYNVKHIQANQYYTIQKDTSENFQKFIYQPSIEKQYIVIKDTHGNIIPQINEIKLERKINYIKGEVRSTLYDAILELGESPELLIAFSDIFQWDIDFFIDPRHGDQFKIVYESFLLPQDSLPIKSEEERFVRYGKILIAQYILQGNRLTAIYFDNSPYDDGYYNLDGGSFQKTFLKSPLNYRKISSYFSYSRFHPILKIVRPHYGVDFAAPKGTPVSAAADGVVIDKGYDRNIGNFIMIRHKNPRYVTLYGHLSKFASGINVSTQVRQKDIIGYVGRTGLATGPHLHYTFYENGKPINPLKIKNTSGDPISKDNLVKFGSVKQQMLTYLEELDKVEIPLVLNLAMWVHFNRYSIEEP